MKIIYLLVHITEYILLVYLGFSAVYILIFALAGNLKKKKKEKKVSEKPPRKFAVLIPCYKEDSVIYDVAVESLNQDYPKEYFEVIIIADSLKNETIEKLKQLPLKLIEVSFEKSTKSKALNKAMSVIDDDYEVALVLDADNIMAYDFIRKINTAFDTGFLVVQGHRIAKNTNTSFAVLDAVSEEINNHIFRKGHRALGFSSALIGSGMAFDYKLFKKTMSKINAVGGFDKELELTLLRDNYKIEFLNDAIILDEKVQKADVFTSQRKRWLSAQFVYFGRYFFPGIKHLVLNGNIDFFDKVYQMFCPPRILLLGFTTIIAILSIIINFIFSNNQIFAIPSSLWIITFLVVVVAFLLSIPLKFYNKQTLIALLTLPKAFLLMFISLFKLKGVNKKFIHTEHGTTNSI